ncbi:MAG: bifunctional folylpolyglutamate synthase/dihydrofolate synthase [Firmicutes bacterium]|nr:bifunctional folylpolyglutamate synthase/dihydrofolate synthase [Bacillota bacterium]
MNRELYARLNNPQAGQKFIHVAGTNGKGSVSAMLAEILNCAGYRTGLFTSPHLAKYNERFKINGTDISDEDFERLKAVVDEAAKGLETVEFDRITAMGFLYFKEQKCDITVLEVGLGGRLDATNVIEDPVVCAIASIGLEHTEILGDTIEQIAFEKAGIIKPKRPVVVQNQSEESLGVFRKKAEETGSRLVITDPSKAQLHSISLDSQVISYKKRKGLSLSLLGSYQFKNALLVLDTVDELIAQGYSISEDAVRKGLANTVWSGRFEVLRKSPLVILDGAHNPNGAEELAQCIKAYLPKKKIHFVMGVLADKNYEAMLSCIAPFAKRFTVVTPESCRALSADRLKEIIESEYNIPAEAAPTIRDGVLSAVLHQSFREPVIIFGSLYQVAEVRRILKEL